MFKTLNPKQKKINLKVYIIIIIIIIENSTV